MREIKFRAWNPTTKMMSAPVDLKNMHSSWSFPLYWAQPLMQYTGLKDKNGKEIYEGDIVQYDFLPEGGDQRAEVIYESRSFCLKNGGNNYMPYQDRMEIIGNIWENPELLK